jgi:Zn finger protein HypA/HybF involved in hydrogenase expression
MTEKVNFECVNCGNKIEHDTKESKIPECCGKPMQVEGIDEDQDPEIASFKILRTSSKKSMPIYKFDSTDF